MNSGYYNQPPYPGVAFPPLQPPLPAPDKPARPWPLKAVNRWMTSLVIGITLLGIALAVLAPRLVTSPPSTAGMTLAYQSSLTQNSSGQLTWEENDLCQFTSHGYVITAPDANSTIECQLKNSSYQNFTLRVQMLVTAGIATIGFLGSDRLYIDGTGRYLLNLPASNQEDSPLRRTSIGSAALHNNTLGVTDRANDIVIQVVGQSYSIYANGQLLATYLSRVQESPGPILLGSVGGQAIFSNIAIYTPS